MISSNEFNDRTGINETCLGYYKYKLVAIIRAELKRGLYFCGLVITSDLSSKSEWMISDKINDSFKAAVGFIPPYSNFEALLIFVSSSFSGNTRSLVTLVATYDLTNFQ